LGLLTGAAPQQREEVRPLGACGIQVIAGAPYIPAI
jgi:hypothetical protein